MTFWQAVLTLIVAVIGSQALAEFVRGLAAKRRDKARLFTPQEALKIDVQVRDVLVDLVTRTGAHSALLMHTENGRRLSVPGQNIAVTVSCEVVTDLKDSCQTRFFDCGTDTGDKDLLREVVGNEIVDAEVSSIRSQMLIDLYQAMGVPRVSMARVGSSINIIRFVSLRWKDHPPSNAHNELRAAVARLNQIFREYDIRVSPNTPWN